MITINNLGTIFFLLLLVTVSIIVNPKQLQQQVITSTTEAVSTVTDITRAISHTVTENARPVNLEQLRCLATNIYYEAGNQSYNGQLAVARVVMNRVAHGFAATPCKVVYQTHTVTNEHDSLVNKLCQFSWVCQGKTTPTVKDDAYIQAEEIARKVLTDNYGHDFLPNNVLFFHATYVNPKWPYKKLKQIGNHIFYIRGKEKEETDVRAS